MSAGSPLRTADTEKITINLGHVDLGRIDLLVQESFHSNGADFMRTAIRNQLMAEREAQARSIERHTLELGFRDIKCAELLVAQQAGEILHVRVVGLARIGGDVTPERAAFWGCRSAAPPASCRPSPRCGPSPSRWAGACRAAASPSRARSSFMARRT